MPSIFIPTKTQLAAYKANPQQIANDKIVEDYMVNDDKFGFLRALSIAMRAGRTSLTYTTSIDNANSIKGYLTGSDYGYGYSESDVVVTPQQNSQTMATITFTWTYST